MTRSSDSVTRAPTDGPHTIVLVSHTHWDREWYHPVGVMRTRLAALIDDLLMQPDGLPFLLDGQAIVLDDYRALRPARWGALQQALRTRQLEAGPWYVLADMLIPGGEALVRNLLTGRRAVRDAGGTPPAVLYSPDAFGHAAAGPLLAEGFGLPVAIVWRGFGGADHPDSAVSRWSHAAGSSVLLYHLPPGGYEVGAALPATPSDAALFWRGTRDALLAGNPVGVSLLPNGADHHARQRQRLAAVTALAAAAVPDRVVADSLSGFAARLTAACADAVLPDVRGELRDSAGWTWSLQGTFATRAQQKRTNAHVERLLVREAEPWSALAWFCGLAPAMQPTLAAAWRTLLATHPHDTLCGCSHDEVAQAADARWAEARQQGQAIRDDALRALVQCDAAAHRDREAQWRPTLVLRNPTPRARGGAVELRLLDAGVADPVGPGSAARSGARVPAPAARPDWSGDDLLQLLRRTREFDRVESPQHYPRNAVVRVSTMMAWIDAMPGYSVATVALPELAALVRAVPAAQRVRGSETELAGPTWRLATSVQGVAATHRGTGARLAALGWLESTTDAGDTYTPSLRGTPLLAQWSAPRLRARGPLRAIWECDAALTRLQSAVSPATDPVARELTQGAAVTVGATATISLDAGADRIDIVIRGENTAGDHRLRWVLPLPASLHRDRVMADAAFGPVERIASTADARAWPAEMRLPTAPLHRWVWLTGDAYGLAVISDGLAEYEITPDGHLAITLLRAVGELSRRDLPERPGHAGWPLATPTAQSLGAFEARFSIVALPTDRIAALTQLEASADDVLTPVIGDTWRGVAAPLPAFPGLSLDGDGLVISAVKESDDGEWLVLRCINPHAVPIAGAWRLPRELSEARTARLDETPDALIAVSGARVEFLAGAHAVVTLVVR